MCMLSKNDYRFLFVLREPGSEKVTILLQFYSYKATMSTDLTKIEKLGCP